MFTQTKKITFKAIYKITQHTADQTVIQKSIADELGTSSASVTDMIKKLTDKSLLRCQRKKYYRVSFNRGGN